MSVPPGESSSTSPAVNVSVTTPPLFDFTVPDELLKEAISRSRDPEAIADLALVPGTGRGPPAADARRAA